MGCQKNKLPKMTAKVGCFRCKKCKSVAKKAKRLCQPKLIKK